MTDELDQAHADLRAHIGDTGTHNFTNTQGFLATTNVWTMTEAAELLASHTEPNVLQHWTTDQRAKALADIIGHIIRQALTVAPIHAELLAGAPSEYSGPLELDTTTPSAFDDD